jgi:hypothetical protein
MLSAHFSKTIPRGICLELEAAFLEFVVVVISTGFSETAMYVLKA